MTQNYIGKTLTAVNLELYAGVPRNPLIVADPFRRSLNKWWHHEADILNSSVVYANKENFFEYNDRHEPYRMEFSYGDVQTLREVRASDILRKERTGATTVDALEDSPFGTSQRVTIEFTSLGDASPQALLLQASKRMPEFFDDLLAVRGNAVVNGRLTRVDGVENVAFRDCAYELQVPFKSSELEIFSGIANRASYVKFEPNYNFFSEKYEETLSGINLNTFKTALPNLYILTDVADEFANNSSPTQQAKLLEHATLNGRIPENTLRTQSVQQQTEDQRDTTRDYFTQWARDFKEFEVDVDGVYGFAGDYKNLIYARSKVEDFNSLLRRKELFPMYTEIQFTTETTTEMAEVLKNSKLDSLLIRDVVETHPDATIRFINSAVTQELAQNESGARILNSNVNVSDVGSRTWDVVEWWMQRISTISEDGEVRPSLDENYLNFDALANGALVGDLFEGISEHPQFRFLRNILAMVFGLGLKEIIKKNLRTAEELLNGVPAYSETVFYEIRKGGPHAYGDAQSFFIPNSNDVDVVKYVDTQVGYGFSHNYEIFAYQLVIGSEYEYNNVVVTGDRMEFDLRQVPVVKLVETLYVPNQRVVVLDKPPIYPDVNMIPYKGVKNRLLIWLNSQVGEYKESPVFLDEGDRDEYNNYLEAQMIDQYYAVEQSPEQRYPIHYRTDDPVDSFEVFRVDKKPLAGKEYEAFMGHKHAIISTNGATAASLVDQLQPNRKYYYTFRAVDRKGHISNPTAIYEVELVENSGAIYPLINTVEIFRKPLKDASRSIRKYVQIRPSFLQRLITDNLTEQGIPSEHRNARLDRLTIGQAHPSMWGKQFKFRFTSKKTGKMIDLNVVFEKRNLVDRIERDVYDDVL